MQTIKLKKGFESAINQEILEKITIENEFIYLNEDNLEISYNLDVSDMDDSPFGDDESDFESFIEEFEESLPELKDYFSHDFEIVYITYSGEYSATMWRYEAGKLMKSSGWIGDFCNNCEDADDEDEARDEFVDANYPNLKQGVSFRRIVGWFESSIRLRPFLKVRIFLMLLIILSILDTY